MYKWLKYIWNALLQTMLRALIETNLGGQVAHTFFVCQKWISKELSASLLITLCHGQNPCSRHSPFFWKESIIHCLLKNGILSWQKREKNSPNLIWTIPPVFAYKIATLLLDSWFGTERYGFFPINGTEVTPLTLSREKWRFGSDRFPL